MALPVGMMARANALPRLLTANFRRLIGPPGKYPSRRQMVEVDPAPDDAHATFEERNVH